MSSNMWQVDLETPIAQSPASILREQGAFLSEKTDGKIIGDVIQDDEFDESGRFWWTMYLRAPALGNYRFRLLSIEHGTDFYPLSLRADEDAVAEIKEKTLKSESLPDPALSLPLIAKFIAEPTIFDRYKEKDPAPNMLEIKTEAQFLFILQEIFNTKRVAKVINAIRAQIAA